jgi:Mycotoxin biosynthesis protein UstYa
MAKLNRSGEILGEYMVAPPDEGIGYVGGLEVFHQLHCLVKASYQIAFTESSD